MKSEAIIRPMRVADWDAIHQIEAEIFPDDPMKHEWFMKRFERDGFFALELDNQVIGLLIVAPFGEEEGHLGKIGVARSHHGKGYGKKLMEYALQWFRSYESIRQVHLYTQDHNTTAQALYRQFGFRVSGTTWHYFVPFDSLKPSGQYTCQEIEEDEIDEVGAKYQSLPAVQMRRFLEYEGQLVPTLKNASGTIVGACRFTPEFPGCFPFLVDHEEAFEDFLHGVKQFGLPKYDYTRFTFTDYPKIAEVCGNRGYKLHHKLFKMTVKLR